MKNNKTDYKSALSKILVPLSIILIVIFLVALAIFITSHISKDLLASNNVEETESSFLGNRTATNATHPVQMAQSDDFVVTGNLENVSSSGAVNNEDDDIKDNSSKKGSKSIKEGVYTLIVGTKEVPIIVKEGWEPLTRDTSISVTDYSVDTPCAVTYSDSHIAVGNQNAVVNYIGSFADKNNIAKGTVDGHTIYYAREDISDDVATGYLILAAEDVDADNYLLITITDRTGGEVAPILSRYVLK